MCAGLTETAITNTISVTIQEVTVTAAAATTTTTTTTEMQSTTTGKLYLEAGWWRNGEVSDLRSTGRGFNSRSCRYQMAPLWRYGASNVGQTHARTDGRLGDFIPCPMLYIASNRQKTDEFSRFLMQMSVCQQSVLKVTSFVAGSGAFGWHNLFLWKLLQSDIFISLD